MKIKTILVISAFNLFVLVNYTIAQTYKYTKTMDDPNETINHMFNFAPVEGHIASSKYATTSLLLAVNGVYGLTNKIGYEFNAGIPYFNIKDEGISYFQGGAFYNFKTKEKIKNSRVILSYKRTRDVYTTKESVTYIEVPARTKITTGLRAGVQYNSSFLETDGIKIAAATSKFTLAGIYAGIQSTSKHLIKTQLNGEQQASPSGGLFRLFADALIYPVSKIENPFLDAQIKSGNIGARGGVVWVPQPYAKKHNPKGYMPFFGRMNMALEIGNRPIDGLYFKGGVYWGLLYR